MTGADVAFAQMQAFVGALASAGLEHACVSPGSRSTPMALALWREPRIHVHVHLDERASAFFALGLGKATGKAAAVACTSGTAAAELFPAVVEAHLSRTPMLLLTADRPPELRGVGANQTIDQVELFGRYVRWFTDAPVPASDDGPGSWRRLGADAIGATRIPHPPGPVHVNLPFREPLVPTDGSRPGEPVASGSAPPPALPPPRPEDVARLSSLLRGVERGVVAAGSLRVDARPVLELAASLRWPVVAEPTSGLRVPGVLAAGQLLLGDEAFRSAHRPQVLLQVGAAPTSRPGLALASEAERLIIVDPDDVVGDPHRRAEWRVVADPAALASEVFAEVDATGSETWLGIWRAADQAARLAADAAMDAWEDAFEGRVARDLAQALPEAATLCVGSSMPVRELDAFMRPREGIRVMANRGASGIDGFVSTTLGVAAAGPPTFALLGDLTLLHDAGSLLWSARRGHDAVFVVPNNGGGAIFSFLAQRGLPAPELEGLFTTPHRTDLARLADTAGARHVTVERADDLVPGVARAREVGGVWIVEVPSDRERNVARHARIVEVVAEALKGR